MSQTEDLSLTTPIFRVAFAHVFEPYTPRQQAQNPTFKPKYELVALFPKTGEYAEDVAAGLQLMKNAAAAAVKAKWGDSVPGNLRNPFRDGAEKADKYAGYKDTTFVRLSSEYKPKIIKPDGSRIVSPEEFYSGCWAHAKVRPYVYDNSGNTGVSFGLGNLLFVRDDTPFGGGSNPEDDFAGIMSQAQAAAGAAAPAAADGDAMFD